MKRRILPTKIMLTELPVEGREFVYDREGEELNLALEDVIGSNPYNIRFKITPMGNVFQLKAQVDTTLDLQCSRCGTDFKQKVSESLSEILVIQQGPMGRGDSTSRVNHTSDLADQSQEATHLETPNFDVGEFFHEIIALAIPIQPLGGDNCAATCENLLKTYSQSWMSSAEEKNIESGKHRPFAALKDLKIN